MRRTFTLQLYSGVASPDVCPFCRSGENFTRVGSSYTPEWNLSIGYCSSIGGCNRWTHFVDHKDGNGARYNGNHGTIR